MGWGDTPIHGFSRQNSATDGKLKKSGTGKREKSEGIKKTRDGGKTKKGKERKGKSKGNAPVWHAGVGALRKE